ncbi:hypothetical protein PEDI_00780 [Persicobacter diffluens]|uniref:Uncharacterized protein n=1 Tax=Persicobacter diffluens TaxID=981 RepID=A0AAN4VT61_9BACT|nr:hypothetical protein PEDI_00780 [Persicobacter diffluens]
MTQWVVGTLIRSFLLVRNLPFFVSRDLWDLMKEAFVTSLVFFEEPWLAFESSSKE